MKVFLLLLVLALPVYGTDKYHEHEETEPAETSNGTWYNWNGHSQVYVIPGLGCVVGVERVDEFRRSYYIPVFIPNVTFVFRNGRGFLLKLED